MDDIDLGKIDDAALALLFLSMDEEGRAWKGLDWTVTDRLQARGLIEDPRNKNKSVQLTPEGQAEARLLFHHLFARTR